MAKKQWLDQFLEVNDRVARLDASGSGRVEYVPNGNPSAPPVRSRRSAGIVLRHLATVFVLAVVIWIIVRWSAGVA